MYDQPTEINCIRSVLVVPQCNVSVFISFVFLIKKKLFCLTLQLFICLLSPTISQIPKAKNPDFRKNYLNMIKKAKYQHYGSKGVKVINVCKSTVSFLQFTLSACQTQESGDLTLKKLHLQLLSQLFTDGPFCFSALRHCACGT